MHTKHESITFVKKVEPEANPVRGVEKLEMPEGTRKRTIAILNAYLGGKMPDFTNVEYNDEEFKEIMEHAENVFAIREDITVLPEDANALTLSRTYRNIFNKLPHHKVDWDPTDKSDKQVVDMLIKRFGLPKDFN
ncbi:MAG: hypothetical protein WCT29_00735 [Candidatus Paceibacterota bacterium]|jgi:hypothetical protein